MLSKLRARFWPTRAEQFAKSVRQSLDWWLLGLDIDATAHAYDPQMIELAKQMQSEGKSIREVTCMLANLWVGDMILARPAAVRAETLDYIKQPAVLESIMRSRASDCVMLLDLVDSASTNSTLLDRGVRAELRRTLFEQAGHGSLSAESQVLFSGVRHLWERVTVAVNLEPKNTKLRTLAGRLIDECIFALEGDDAEARTARHIAKAFQSCLDKADLRYADESQNAS